MPPRYKDVGTQTDIDLTSFPETPTGKRRREAGEEPESSSKRARNAITPPPRAKPFFSSTWRTRSALSVPPKISILDSPTGFIHNPPSAEPLRESPFYSQILKPTADEKIDAKDTDEAPPQTPKQQSNSSQPGIFGSVKKIFGLFKASSPTKSNTEAAQEVNEPPPPPPSQQTLFPGLDETSPPKSPEGPPPPHVHQAAYDQYFKRRRYGETKSGQAFLAAKAREVEVEFEAMPGSNKRKLASLDGKTPGPKAGGFGIDDSYLDVDHDIEDVDSNVEPTTPTKNILQPQTPLRSALRQNATIGRSGKSVMFNPNTAVKHVYGSYGPAGQYHGSVFSDNSAASDSSVSMNNPRSILSPTTLDNTQKNETPRFELDNNVFDPNDKSWRPSLANPSPGRFRLPEADEYDDFDDSELSLLEKEQRECEAQTNVPPQPSTPRMAHAELPLPSSSSAISSYAGHPDSILANDSQEIRLNKARSEAQKYKPVRSSRLSHGEPARSRSSSPPLAAGETTGDFTESNIQTSTPGPTNFRPHYEPNIIMEESTIMEEPAFKPLGREELDNTTVGEDGMTDYQREHQYDDWAKNIFDNVAVQTYEEAGVASSYIAELVRQNWTQKDTNDSIAFWNKEFDEGIEADREARAEGKRVLWITDPAQLKV
ncbi:uncharacterized protein A1O9_09308 [Exophiala aquamarina CBS 119918]|uniref:Uncharacterized protein n=1 Tax=Exophiala aquamarina CBS 119918 TaxID=1182545 RepID=A0A072PH73_9EURO|nr:uncharacterized protein A1O9_09308 [Exophiala aquamarina CBS 119918]KEF54865.1 hypothetical protein A1O9_09308 [Exophiala aquamarina CBS 119918]